MVVALAKGGRDTDSSGITDEMKLTAAAALMK
jgi:hypothetical protein